MGEEALRRAYWQDPSQANRKATRESYDRTGVSVGSFDVNKRERAKLRKQRCHRRPPIRTRHSASLRTMGS
jgi:hypothetical protein